MIKTIRIEVKVDGVILEVHEIQIKEKDFYKLSDFFHNFKNHINSTWSFARFWYNQ